MRETLRRLTAVTAALLLPAAALPLPAAAGVIPTEDIVPGTVAARDRLHELLDRDEVRAALARHGVAPADVQARVDALTDAEAATLAADIDRMPAGGDVLGLLFTVFVLLLLTDVLGLTKVFPFTRPMR
jgi:hypothetical protein